VSEIILLKTSLYIINQFIANEEMYNGHVYRREAGSRRGSNRLPQCICVRLRKRRISSSKTLNQKMIREYFPWDRLPENCPKKMRFGLKTSQETFWLDLGDEEDLPLFAKDIVFVKLSEGF
jgi:hypothetical protein